MVKKHLTNLKQVELSIDRELDFMIKYQLFPEELLIIQLIFLAQNEHPEYLSKYFSQMPLKGAPRDTLLALQEKGIINKSYKIPEKGATFNPRDVDFNKVFMKSYMQHSGEMGMELFINYPSFVNIGGRQCSLKNISKLFKSMDDFCFAYGKIIKFNPETHNKIMTLLEFGKENQLIHYGISEFLISQKWLEIEELQNSGGTLNGYNNSELL